MIRNLVLSGGPAHDFRSTSDALVGLFAAHGATSSVVESPAEAIDRLRGAEEGAADAIDVLTVNALHWQMEVERYAELRAEHGFALTAEDAAVIDRFVRSGGGLLALHTAVICFDAEPRWHALCGASWSWEASTHPPLGTVQVQVTDGGRAHPLTAGLDDFVVEDEIYCDLVEDLGVVPLLTGEHAGRAHPVLWARAVGRGRVVTDLLGHGTASIEHPTHRRILGRAVAWLTEGDAPRAAAASTDAAGSR